MGGALAGISALSRGRAQKPEEYVTTVAYDSGTFAQKRTPADKLKGKGVVEIQAVEQRLQTAYLAMRADELQAFFSTSQYNELQPLLPALATARPTWNRTAYQQEATFFFHQDIRRYQLRQLRNQQLAQARAVRAQARYDSLARVERHQQAQQDSLRYALALRERQVRDSLGQAALAAPALVEVAAGPATPTGVVRSHGASSHKKAAVVPHQAVSRGPVVYYCASGNTVKYHASLGCRGLTRCGGPVVKISQREAEQSMNPCKFCH